MSIKSKLALIALSTAIAFYTVVGGLLSDRTNVLAKGDPYIQLKIFGEVLKHIVRDYVDEPDMEKVRVGALKGLAEGLDPYSAYLTREQVARFNADVFKRNTMGATFSKVSGFLYVVAVLKGSPAETAGLRSGDFIEYVGQVATRDVSLYDIQETLAAIQPNQEIEFTVLRRGKSEKIKVKPSSFGQPMIESRLEEPEVGYIKVTTLASGKATEVKANLAVLLKKGTKKIVLDLRGTTNGDIQEGVALTNLFIESGPIARTIGHKGEITKTFEAEPDRRVFDGPLVVLTNRSTAGPAEILAAAMLASKRGEVIGEKTFGAGSEQELFKLQDGAGMLLTTVKYAPATGKPFMEESVKPSIEMKPSDSDDGLSDENDDSTNQPNNQNPKDKNNSKDKTTPDKKTPNSVNPPDSILKKALEVLKGNGAVVEKKAA